MRKEEIYVNLQGKTKEELTDLWHFLTNNGEKPLRDLERFLEYSKYRTGDNFTLAFREGEYNDWINSHSHGKTEVTIEQLKQIIKPMKTKFTPIAMKCTQEQFEAVKPKLNGFRITSMWDFEQSNYLVNNADGVDFHVVNVGLCNRNSYKRKVYEEWNEEIFLKACGIEVESLEQQLEKAKAEVKRLEEEIESNKPKVGDWCKFWDENELEFCLSQLDYITEEDEVDFYATITGSYYTSAEKITNPELIKLLEDEITRTNKK